VALDPNTNNVARAMMAGDPLGSTTAAAPARRQAGWRVLWWPALQSENHQREVLTPPQPHLQTPKWERGSQIWDDCRRESQQQPVKEREEERAPNPTHHHKTPLTCCVVVDWCVGRSWRVDGGGGDGVVVVV
jgi:hypothetical protein